MLKRQKEKYAALSVALFMIACRSDVIRDRPISFSEWRMQQTLEYVNKRYGVKQQTLEMLPVMVVSHYTAMDSLDVSFDYLNREEMESGRSLLKKAGGANIAVHYLVGKAGEIFRLMPENHIGRHVIGLNRHAIGIENVGHDANSLTLAQVEANALIIRRLVKKYPIRYLIGHSEYRQFEKTPLWEELDDSYRTEKHDPGENFMTMLRERVADLDLRSTYDRSEIPARIGFILHQAAARGDFSGVALVIDDGKIIFREAIGTNPETGKALKLTDKFYLASAAKSLTALLIAKLEAERKLSYDTPVAAYFPELKNLLAGVKIRHLLSHTSGLTDYYRFGLPTPGFSNADALRLIGTQTKLLAAPGARFHYANSNYLLLAELAERIMQQSFPQLLRDKLLLPAGMQNTIFIAENPPNAVLAAQDSNGGIFRYSYLTIGPGGLAATADDLAALDLAFVEHRLLSAAQMNTLLRPVLRADNRPEFYAFGWYILPQRKTVCHDGNFNGYHTMNWMYPARRQAIILLSNRYTTKIRELTGEIDRVLNGNEALAQR